MYCITYKGLKMLENLFIKSIEFVKNYNLDYKRYFLKTNNLEHRLSIILGDRGIGKISVLENKHIIILISIFP